MAQITVEEFRNFFKYYKGESHQQRAVEMLYEDIAHHLDDNSEWIQQYRTPDKAPAGEPVGVSFFFLMEQLTGYPASSFVDVFVAIVIVFLLILGLIST